MGWGSKAPKPDKLIGEAAMKSAETADRAQTWAMEVFDNYIVPRQNEMDALTKEVTNQQLADMRSNAAFTEEQRKLYRDVYEPLERQSAAEIAGYGGADMVSQRRGIATAAVDQSFSQARSQAVQEMAKYGIQLNPNALAAQMRRLATAQGAAGAGARMGATFDTQDRGIALRAQTASMARGVPIAASGMATQTSGIGSQAVGNSGSAVGSARAGTGVAASGFGTAIQGYGTAGQLMNTQYANQVQAYANDPMMGLFGTAIGAGATLGAAKIMSSKKVKDRNESLDGDDVLTKVKGLKVDRWGYKGDSQLHVGPYAEELHQKFGIGDGTTIGPTDVGGVALAAVKQLNDKVDALGKRMGLNLEAA